VKHSTINEKAENFNYRQQYYLDNKERLNAISKSYYRKHRRELIAKQTARYTVEERRHKSVKYKFGLTIEQYEALKSKQNNRCAICNRTQQERVKLAKELAVDHNHETNEIRGLLCNPCNRAIGMMKEDPELLEKAASYLRGTSL
jgi:ATP-dependent 26S proteasome regulatory subunit